MRMHCYPLRCVCVRLHMHMYRSADCSEGDDEMSSPWIIRHVFGSDARVLKVTLLTYRTKRTTRWTRILALWVRDVSL